MNSGHTAFSSEIHNLVPLGAMRDNRARLEAAVRTIQPDGETRVRDAAVTAVEAVDQQLKPGSINAVVLLTDGEDTVSARSADDVVRTLDAEGRKETGHVRLFTIAYGRDANKAELQRFAEATGGKAYAGTNEDIESVYLSISSFF